MQKIIFFDVDGTLINSQFIIEPTTIECLKELKQKGYLLCIATGRSYDSLLRTSIIDIIDWDGIICNNGQLVLNEKQAILKRYLIPNASAKEFIDMAKQLNYPVVVKCKERFITQVADDNTRFVHRHFNNEVPTIGQLTNQEVERNIIKKYRKELWRPFIKAINEYQLIKDGDHIGICISGGKDSMLMAKLFQELQRHGKNNFEIEFIVMDPGYKEEYLQLIKDNAVKLNIPVQIFNSDIFEVVDTVEGNPCYLCARMRRGYLYRFAQQLGCNKIALGHHFDDAIETILMSMFYGSEVKTMMPKLHSDNFKGMELIRPLYLVKEAAIIRWRDYHHLEFLQCACRLTATITEVGGGSKRTEMKRLIAAYRKIYPNVDINIFKSIHNINLDTVIGYKKDGVNHSFLDDYDKE